MKMCWIHATRQKINDDSDAPGGPLAAVVVLEVRKEQLPHEHVELQDYLGARAELDGGLLRVLGHRGVQAPDDGGDGREVAARGGVRHVGAWEEERRSGDSDAPRPSEV